MTPNANRSCSPPRNSPEGGRRKWSTRRPATSRYPVSTWTSRRDRVNWQRRRRTGRHGNEDAATPDLSEREYWSVAKRTALAPFDFDYVQQLGFALLENRDHWQRGCELLRIAAHGQPAQATNLYMHIAHTHDKHGDRPGLWANYLTTMKIARVIGVQNLQPADKEALFLNVKKVGDLALKENNLDVALEAYKFVSTHENAGIETWRTLANLFEKIAERAQKSGNPAERNQNIWQSLHCTEHAHL